MAARDGFYRLPPIGLAALFERPHCMRQLLALRADPCDSFVSVGSTRTALDAWAGPNRMWPAAPVGQADVRDAMEMSAEHEAEAWRSVGRAQTHAT